MGLFKFVFKSNTHNASFIYDLHAFLRVSGLYKYLKTREMSGTETAKIKSHTFYVQYVFSQSLMILSNNCVIKRE